MVFSSLAASSFSHQWGEINKNEKKNSKGRRKRITQKGGEKEGGKLVGNPGIAPKAGMLPLPRKSSIQKLPNSMRQKYAHDKSAFMLLPNLAESCIKCKVRPRGRTEKHMWSRVMQPKLHMPSNIFTMNWGQRHQASSRGGDFYVFSPQSSLHTEKPDSSCYHGTIASLVSEHSCRYTRGRHQILDRKVKKGQKFSNSSLHNQRQDLRGGF